MRTGAARGGRGCVASLRGGRSVQESGLAEELSEAGAGAGEEEADAEEAGAEADGERFDSYFAPDTDVSEDTLRLSASSGRASLTVKKKVKTKNANDKKKKKTNNIMHI